MNPKLKLVCLCLVLVTAIGGALLLAGCSKGGGTASAERTLYTCGMHPQVIQDHPGNCPICGMKLTPIRKAGGAVPAGEKKIQYYKSTMIPGETSPQPGKDSMGMDMVPVYADQTSAVSVIAIDPVTRQNMNLRTTEVVRGPLRRTIRTVGTIAYNETALADVTTKFKGWVEKLYVDSTGQQVHRGDPLFEVYSPELYSAQVEYLLALNPRGNHDAGLANLRETALSKLKFFDISDAQIAELEHAGKPGKTLKILAPIDGFVTEKMVVEGQMVDTGMKLYRLADLGLVWVYAELYEQDLPYIQLGQEAVVKLSYLPDREFRGRVTYVYPNVDEKTRTARVRMEFHNPGYFLKPGMFATVRVESELKPSVLLVPDSAVLRSGERNSVFVALAEGKFEPRTVSLGQPAEGDRYEVISGLREGERVVTSGQFMLDSESQLREAIQKMREPGASGSAHDHAGMSNEAAVASATPAPGEAAGPSNVYICPMPEHVSIEYDHPGKCPICGMTLVPVSSAMLRKLPPGGKVLYYTCPMPEHSDVHEDKPGKCPHCGMTLIPVMEAPPTPAMTVPVDLPLLYTCPMASDADVVSDQPGKCPKCEMELVPTSTVKHGRIAEENWRKQHAH
jgi:membrane fusion protein, copper/silver efflux system